MTQSYRLKVSALERSTSEALTIQFDLPSDVKPHFSFKPGQFLTLRCGVGSETLQRAYSINSAPALDDPLQVTVKKIKDGRVSTWLHENLKVGDTLEVLPPRGRFTPDITSDNHRTWFLFGAGSGITPLFSILKQILTIEPYSYVYLFYGSRNEEQIIFHKLLTQWEERYPERLKVVHTLTKPISSSWSALWKNVPRWKGRTGRIDADAVREFIASYPPPAQRVRYCICGPGDMIDTVRQTLLSLDVPKGDIQSEHFGAGPVARKAGRGEAARLNVNHAGETATITVAPGQTLLRAMLDAGRTVPYSCESGVCGTCRARVVKGSAEMKQCMALDEAEQVSGHILTCQALATTPELTIRIETS